MGAFRDDLSQVVHVPLPAPGAGFTHKLSGAEYSRIRTISLALTTSATTANRTVSLAIQHGDGVTVAAIPSPAAQTATQTDEYTWGIGLFPYSVNASSAVVMPLPDIWLRLGDKIVVTIDQVQTADAIKKIRLIVDQVSWLEAQGE